MSLRRRRSSFLSNVATSSTAACCSRDRFECSPLLINSETLSTFCHDAPLCQAGAVMNSKTVANHILQRNTEDRLILDHLLFSSVKEMWRLAVCFQLRGVVKIATNQCRWPHGSRITRNQTLEQRNNDLGILSRITFTVLRRTFLTGNNAQMGFNTLPSRS